MGNKRKSKMAAPFSVVLPYTGNDHPIIDGEGVTSHGREGTGSKKSNYISEKFNEYDACAPTG